MKVNKSRKKSGLKYAPKLNKGWKYFGNHPFSYVLHESEIRPKYRKLRPIEINDRLPF